MSIWDDMLGRPTAGEIEIRARLSAARAHADALEEKLVIVDPREATDTAVHSRVCWERQVAAQAWRKANALQGQLNGAELRRYSRGITCWMVAGFIITNLHGLDPAGTLAAIIKFLMTI
jgi:hypothetical protein